MEKDKIFFGENGLTTTSANYTANLAKEAYMEIEHYLNNITFYDTTASLMGSITSHTINEGVKDISDIKLKLEKISQLKSLIAWLREAIKAKDALIAEARNTTYEDLRIEVPACPEKEHYITSDDVIGTWTIKQRNRYYYLETLCAQIGGYIHPQGQYSVARKKLAEIINKPNKIDGTGRDAIIYSSKPSIDSNVVEDSFMDLQNTYRSYQAELNSLKHSIETAIEDDKREKDAKFSREYREYSDKIRIIQNTLVEEINKRVSEAQKLKIIIPDSLKNVYDEIQKLGK